MIAFLCLNYDFDQLMCDLMLVLLNYEYARQIMEKTVYF